MNATMTAKRRKGCRFSPGPELFCISKECCQSSDNCWNWHQLQQMALCHGSTKISKKYRPIPEGYLTIPEGYKIRVILKRWSCWCGRFWNWNVRKWLFVNKYRTVLRFSWSAFQRESCLLGSRRNCWCPRSKPPPNVTLPKLHQWLQLSNLS